MLCSWKIKAKILDHTKGWFGGQGVSQSGHLHLPFYSKKNKNKNKTKQPKFWREVGQLRLGPNRYS